jgi:hypothetical protein
MIVCNITKFYLKKKKKKGKKKAYEKKTFSLPRPPRLIIDDDCV